MYLMDVTTDDPRVLVAVTLIEYLCPGSNWSRAENNSVVMLLLMLRHDSL